MDLVEDLVSVFSRGDLVLVAEFLGLAPTSTWGQRKLTRAILSKIEDSENLPETDGSRGGDLFEDFVVVIMGDEQEEEDGLEEKEEDPVTAYLKRAGKELPDCWSYADAVDPACKKCGIYKWCAEERIANLPQCYGVRYDQRSGDCKGCIDAPFCKEGTNKERRA